PWILYLFYNYLTPIDISTLSLHDALPISIFDLMNRRFGRRRNLPPVTPATMVRRCKPIPSARRPAAIVFASTAQIVFPVQTTGRSEEHTSELQSRGHLVCRLLLEKKSRAE